jgi:hypothetical protein
VGDGPSQLAVETPSRHISPVNDGDLGLLPLDPPRSRRPSLVSESSDASSAVISTAARLTRASITVNVTTQPSPAVIPDDVGRASQPITVTSEHLLGSTLSSVQVELPEG